MPCDVQINFKKCALVFGMKTLFCIEHLVYPGNEAMLKKTTNVEEVWNYFKIFGNISQYLEIFEDIIEYLDLGSGEISLHWHQHSFEYFWNHFGNEPIPFIKIMILYDFTTKHQMTKAIHPFSCQVIFLFLRGPLKGAFGKISTAAQADAALDPR